MVRIGLPPHFAGAMLLTLGNGVANVLDMMSAIVNHAANGYNFSEVISISTRGLNLEQILYRLVNESINHLFTIVIDWLF